MSLSAFDIEIIEAIKQKLDADLRQHHSAGYLAQLAGMSESRLKEIFKVVVKTNLYTYIRQKRMALAAELLEQSNTTFKQVSKQTGFKYYSNFTRAFKRYYGITPATHRKQFLKD